jgi:hypothetical protein
MNNADFVDVYNRVYDEILGYINNKTVDIDGIEFNIVNFDEDIDLIEDYILVGCLEEDKIDDYLKYRHFNYREDSVILFNIPIYLRENLKSYRFDPSEIWEQFEKDCPRSTIYVNDKQIFSRTDLIENLSMVQPYTVRFKQYVLNLMTIIAMLCNQSSYAFPYIFLSKVQNMFDSNVIASNCTDNREIKIETILSESDKTSLKFTIKTDVIMRNIKNCKIDAKANVTLVFDTNPLLSTDLTTLFKPHGMFLINFYSDR